MKVGIIRQIFLPDKFFNASLLPAQPTGLEIICRSVTLSIVSFTQFWSDTLQTVCGVHSDCKHAFIKQLSAKVKIQIYPFSFHITNDTGFLSHDAPLLWRHGHAVKTRGTWHEDPRAWQIHAPRHSSGGSDGFTLAKYRKSWPRRVENITRSERHSPHWPGSPGVYSLHSSGSVIRQFWRQRSKVCRAWSRADADKWNWIERK